MKKYELEHEIWQKISQNLSKKELNKAYPNGFISFCVKLRKNDQLTLALIDANS